jgi:Glycosyl hydrolase family 92
MRAPFTLYNDETGFMEARNADGSWAGEDRGWTEGMPCPSHSPRLKGNDEPTFLTGDKWAYTFDVVHAIPELIKRRGGKIGFVKSLEKHFEEGHNDHANEVCLPGVVDLPRELTTPRQAVTSHSVSLFPVGCGVQGSGEGSTDRKGELQ